MEKNTTITITPTCRKKLGEKCPKDLTFSDFIEELLK